MESPDFTWLQIILFWQSPKELFKRKLGLFPREHIVFFETNLCFKSYMQELRDTRKAASCPG